jgi:hypothetical protein
MADGDRSSEWKMGESFQADKQPAIVLDEHENVQLV